MTPTCTCNCCSQASCRRRAKRRPCVAGNRLNVPCGLKTHADASITGYWKEMYGLLGMHMYKLKEN